MRRALSLLAFGSTLLIASSASVDEFTTSIIKALNTPAADKDSWSFKGTVNEGPDYDMVTDVMTGGTDSLELNLDDSTADLDSVIFDADQCKSIRNGKGVTCRSNGARFTGTEAKDKDGSKIYKISGSFHRREFDADTIDDLLEVEIITNVLCYTSANECTVKEGANGQLRGICKTPYVPKA